MHTILSLCMIFIKQNKISIMMFIEILFISIIFWRYFGHEHDLNKKYMWNTTLTIFRWAMMMFLYIFELNRNNQVKHEVYKHWKLFKYTTNMQFYLKQYIYQHTWSKLWIALFTKQHWVLYIVYILTSDIQILAEHYTNPK